MEKNIVTHCIAKDKFTTGYVNFMNQYMVGNIHRFIIIDSQETYNDLSDILCSNNVYYIKHKRDLLIKPSIRKMLNMSDKIIVSGLFGMFQYLVKFSNKLLNKTYFHFWGGDFYWLAEKNGNIIEKWYMISCLKRCNAYIFLIEGEYEQLVNFTGIQKKHYVAPMPPNTNLAIDYDKIKLESLDKSHIKVLLGNSATESNRHISMLHMLEKFKDNNMEIICPLSYGNANYKDMVITIGKDIFGEKFIPIIDFMNKEQYVKLLNSCEIGIFNNNRQQAMGNINVLLQLEKKVYIDKNTSMWTSYFSDGITLADVNSISDLSFQDFVFQSKEEKEQNYNMIKNRLSISNVIKKWEIIMKS